MARVPLLFLLLAAPALAAELPHSVWIEAEHLGPLKGGNFSFQKPEQTTKGSWSLAGPDVAAAWTQGGESEFLSIACRADEPAGTAAARPIEIPAAGAYTLWVRYADYRGKEEAFGVRVTQAGKSQEHVFGRAPIADELDPLGLIWDWSFAWDSAPVTLAKGTAAVEVYSTGPTGARRQVDCLCLTTDPSYRPTGREKPLSAASLVLQGMRGGAGVQPLVTLRNNGALPKEWRIASAPTRFLWNAGQPWLDELKKPLAERVDAPFATDPSLAAEFTTAFRGRLPPVYGDPASGAVIHIPLYPATFAAGSPFLDWLNRNPARPFALLWNYGEPTWPAGADRPAVRANLRKYQDRFFGLIAGEAVSYAPPDHAALEAKVRAAKSRGEVLAALRDAHTVSLTAKLSDYFGGPVGAEEAWSIDVPCLSASMEALAHALCDWGVKRLGHENTGNSPTLARRLAFMRGAARQFGARIFDYQSCNLGDSSTVFSRESYLYPASSRYIYDNQYDAWAGAGLNWLLKDYLLFHVAGAEAIYHEEGHDIFWKPGGGAAGDDFPVQLSPKGKVAQAIQALSGAHPRGTQYTPVAFLLDEAHGWAQERFSPGAFALDPQWNPSVLAPGRHEASIRGWFDVAYYPAPLTQNEPAGGVRQTYVNGIFGDLFDVIVTAPKHAAIASTYPVLIAAGEVPLTEEWGRALAAYVRGGGTLVACADQFTGPGLNSLGLPGLGEAKEASSFSWGLTGERVASNLFRYHPVASGRDQVLAAAPDGTPIATLRKEGKGQLIFVGVPLGLGIDDRPVPILAHVLRHLTEGLSPVRVTGDVEWTLNRLDDGAWVVTLLNNRGVYKPQHGVTPTDHTEAQSVTLRSLFPVKSSAEWIAGKPIAWRPAPGGAEATLTIPAGGIRVVEVRP